MDFREGQVMIFTSLVCATTLGRSIRSVLLISCAVCLLGSAAPGRQVSEDCHGLLRPRQVEGDQVLVLVAAGVLFDEMSPLANRILGQGWRTMDPDQLTATTSPDSLDFGVQNVCSWLRSLPGQERGRNKYDIENWIESYHTVEAFKWLLDVESLGSAVANLQDTRGLFPRSQSQIAAQGKAVGESLSAGENTELWYKLASYLAARTRSERLEIVEGILRLGQDP